MDQKTVFISYRRALSKHLARSIYQDLKMNGWDVFLDVNTIDSGDFDRIILNQIGARAHFVLLISPGSLERCASSGDWVLREIQEAVRLERNIVPIIEEGADFTREMGYLPSDLRAIVSKKNALPLPHFFFDAAVEMLRTRYLKWPEYIRITDVPASERAEEQRRMASVDTASPASPKPSKPRALDLLPAPFAWCPITAGKVKLGSGGYLKSDTTFEVPAFQMAKYPITNAQYRLFIDAGGYNQQRWWTAQGWAQRESEKWTQPRYWTDAKWNGAEQPVVGVSWYEAIAFCLWLSETTGEKIMLPTEQQWQRAAQGDDGRAYPWGKYWDKKACQHSVGSYNAGVTSAVRAYEGKGDSPFGVVDMAGNVWEWCLTDYESGDQGINKQETYRVLRGGSWNNSLTDGFRCVFRYGNNPRRWNDNRGFRPSLSY